MQKACNRLRQNNPLYPILANIASKAKKQGIAFDLTLSDVAIPEDNKCPILGIDLDLSIGCGRGSHDARISIDRIDPNRGYVKGNVQVISARANRIKNDASLKELEAIVNYMKKLKTANE